MATETATTTERTLSYGKGYAGMRGQKCWAAEITGTDNTFALQRTFLEPTKVEREHFNRARTMIQFTYELELDGLYELCEAGQRWFVAAYPKDGEVRTMKLSDARVKAWVAALDAGSTPTEARLATKGL